MFSSSPSIERDTFRINLMKNEPCSRVGKCRCVIQLLHENGRFLDGNEIK
jgi:hypothetical protein